MSIVIEYIVQNNHGNFAGFLMMGALDRPKDLSNFAKTLKSQAPDYRIFGKCLRRWRCGLITGGANFKEIIYL